MIAYAAIDLRGGRVVQLVGGRPEAERISLPDPAAVAREWTSLGFAGLHVVDLDAALGTGDNGDGVDAILSVAGGVAVQTGGGVRTTERVDALLGSGAARVVVGTRAVTEPSWLAELAARHPGRVVVAADVRDNEVVTHGWVSGSGVHVREFLGALDDLPLGAVLVTDVDREGHMAGADIALFTQLIQATRHPLIASGGVTTMADLAALADAGAAGVVLGMALYTHTLDGRTVAREYGS